MLDIMSLYTVDFRYAASYVRTEIIFMLWC